MKQTTSTLFYLISFAGLLLLAFFIFKSGKNLEQSTLVLSAPAAGADELAKAIADAFKHPLAIFILQLILIISVSQVCAFIFKKLGQPTVMGEIVAGILLGPSLVGLFFPDFSAFIFPVASLGNLQMLSQVGLILFMFVIGLELDINLLKEKANAAVLISYFGIIIPFGMGIVLSYFLYRQYAPANIPFYAFSLFTGIAMSITAFPVLARIIRERGLSKTRLGTIAITAAATDDVVAWCMLAFIVAVVKGGSLSSTLYIISAVIVYVCCMIFIIKPLLSKLASRSGTDIVMKRSVMAFIFVVLLLSSYCCEVIGIHALFGAFLAGAIIPREKDFRTMLINKIEDVVLVLLLPLFFVFTGLRTQVQLLNDVSIWLTCAGIITVAVAGKFLGTSIAARIAGENVKDSLSIGALMNTRGLVELVVLNVGYDLGILSPKLFTMMVLMALTTTFMTNPAINLINKIFK